MLKNKNLNNFKKKIFNKQSKISIMGLGYVGLPLALSFAKSGYNVHGYDIDRFKIHSNRVGDEINNKHLIIKNY